ncbi:N-acetyltransferase [Kurthia zopfii]|uniref:RimJ/RimL family protein N-acetyltransferase n=1 Tax=Kurthia zopfii TaxID=1650 RepID=A0A8B4QE32_9BACL|nr:GNAT family N-acetyltransferase [Kurthia zopfii]TDR42114.1 RimJ/RimL family protein N-acetyltransferase [Kurthia zopfii]GEK29946.1 N-acetyltransferase [Kurthia zopfii]STX10967.1 Spermine/spermidine acetyltransferase [Kurthia zopfii]VEI05659.1 Spermine/spermidine acetyltransferase [Kurthia zopfii]
MLEIRILTENDAHEYWDLRKQALLDVPDAFGMSYEEAMAIENPIDEVKEVTKGDLKDFYGVFLDGELVGAATLSQEDSEKMSHRANIEAVYVSSKARGTGAGSALLKKIIEDARKNPELEKLNLSVVTTNEPAVALYKRLGFEIIGTEQLSMKQDGTYFDEYLMTLIL